jgi:hypothetical protein
LRKLLTTLVVALGALAAASGAAANPPLDTNPNAEAKTFDCGADGTFQAVTIQQSASVVAQIDGGGVFVIVRALRNGQVVYNVPGWEDKPTLACKISPGYATGDFFVFIAGPAA